MLLCLCQCLLLCLCLVSSSSTSMSLFRLFCPSLSFYCPSLCRTSKIGRGRPGQACDKSVHCAEMIRPAEIVVRWTSSILFSVGRVCETRAVVADVHLQAAWRRAWKLKSTSCVLSRARHRIIGRRGRAVPARGDNANTSNKMSTSPV